MRKTVAFVLHILVLSVALVDASLYAYVSISRHSPLDSAVYYRDKAAIESSSPPTGYSAAGVSLSQPEFGRGWAVRYATPRCEFSRADQLQWNTLREHLIQRGYRIYVLPPTQEQRYPEGSAELKEEMELAYVDIQWMKDYRFQGTPTTLLFNESGKLIWSHAGVMSGSDIKSAFKASE